MPVATNLIHFALTGPGKILGVGNGDPSCHEPDVYVAQSPLRSVPENEGWRWKKLPNVRSPRLPEFRESFDDSSWDTANVQTENGPLGDQEQAVFRTKIQVSEQDLAAASAVELSFSRIDDDGYVYVNGRRAGESHDWETPAVLDVKPFLHPGENVIAVGVANASGPGGLGGGVTLQFAGQPVAPEWKRSVFNGLAQIIVQAAREPGDLQLTARADGLTPATVTIQSQPGAARPYVP